VAHRFSTIRNSSKIIVLNEGKIEAIGNHENLLKVSETYKYLSELQT
jgi:ABC-type multidrug transport system fused ATPase/permease subunit